VFVSTGPPDASFLGAVVAAAYRRAASG
jgi:hypothetical protein